MASAKSTRRPRISLLATGGTISAIAAARGQTGTRGASTIAHSAGLHDVADVRSVDIEPIPSRAMTPSAMRALAATVIAEIEAGADGVVVTHGTDTLEETAYALSVMVPRRVPVVLTGAMRHPGATGFDGDANLRGAVIAAARTATTALGPLVVFGDEAHLARWVTKVHTSRPAAFASPGLGPVGTLTESHFDLAVLSAPDDYLGLPGELDTPVVELLWVSAGMSPRLFDAALEYAAGIVVAGTGGGHVPPAVADALERAVTAGVHVVVATRCLTGSVLEGSYTGRGSEIHLRELGVLGAGALAPLKARLRLQIALALKLQPAAVFRRRETQR